MYSSSSIIAFFIALKPCKINYSNVLFSNKWNQLSKYVLAAYDLEPIA